MNLECAHEIAIKYIGISKKSEFEVRLKLNRYGFSNLIVDQTIDFLKSIGYIDDAMYVDAYIIQCMHLLNYSIYEIKNKLLQKGINKNIIEDKIKKISSTDYEC
ncbi:MAG: regulatory protein RecX, partial [Clostridia bacterium]